MDTRDGGIPGNAGVKSCLGATRNSEDKKGSVWQEIIASDLKWFKALVRQAEAEAADYLERMGK